jgi:hypothetical protein
MLESKFVWLWIVEAAHDDIEIMRAVLQRENHVCGHVETPARSSRRQEVVVGGCGSTYVNTTPTVKAGC